MLATTDGQVFDAAPLIGLFCLTAKKYDIAPDSRTMAYMLAEIFKGLDCDWEHKHNLLPEANMLLWELKQAFQEMAITNVVELGPQPSYVSA